MLYTIAWRLQDMGDDFYATSKVPEEFICAVRRDFSFLPSVTFDHNSHDIKMVFKLLWELSFVFYEHKSQISGNQQMLSLIASLCKGISKWIRHELIEGGSCNCVESIKSDIQSIKILLELEEERVQELEDIFDF